MEQKLEVLHGIELMGKENFGEEFWTSEMNYLPEVHQNFPKETLIYDVTLRDGEQAPGVCWNEDERVRIAEELEEMGLKRLEIGMPATSKTIAKAVKRLQNNGTKLDLVALCRANKKDIDLALDMGVKSVIVEHSINPYTCKYAMGLEYEELMDRLITSTQYAMENGLNTNFFGWDALRTSIPYLQKVFGTIVKECHPHSITITDTVGTALPATAKLVVEKVREAVGDTPVQWHGHNEFGMGTACALAAIEGGAAGVHTAMNGLGERTGNAPTEEVVTALELLCGVKTGVHLEKIGPASKLIEAVGKAELSSNKPIVGRNLEVVESGLVTDVFQKMRKVGIKVGMSCFTQEMVGNPPMKDAIGKGSGKANIVTYLVKNNVNPDEITKEQMGEIIDRVKTESRIRKGLLDEATLMRIVFAVLAKE